MAGPDHDPGPVAFHRVLTNIGPQANNPPPLQYYVDDCVQILCGVESADLAEDQKIGRICHGRLLSTLDSAWAV